MAELLDGVRLGNREAVLAAYLVRAGVTALERRNGSIPEDALQLRDELATFARRISYAQASASGETANVLVGTDPAASAQISAAAAALQLGVSAQAVRSMCRRGALIASQSPAGAWRIDGTSVLALAALRKEAS